MTEDIWEELVEKYGIHGYDNSSVIINYKTLIDLTKKAEKLEAVKAWLIKAKAEGRISMNVGFSLGLVLGVEE